MLPRRSSFLALAMGVSALAACDSGTAPTPVEPGPPAHLEVLPVVDTVNMTGDSVRFEAIVTDAEGIVVPDANIEWRSTRPEIATVDAGGSVVAVGVGSAWIVATAAPASDSARITVIPLSPVRFTAVDAGYVAHACALTDEGLAYCWGENRYAELGTGADRLNRSAPVPVDTDLRFVQVKAGNRHGCGLTGDGEVWCWGEGSFIGTAAPDMCDGLACSASPRRVEGLPPIASLHGTRNTCALGVGGEAYCLEDEPVRLFPELDVIDMADTETRYCVLTDRGEVWCHYHYSGSSTETPVGGDPSFVSLTGGYAHYCALTGAGAAYCWGTNGGGQLGVGDMATRDAPTPVVGDRAYVGLSGGGYTHTGKVYYGATQTCGVGPDGAGYCWGLNSGGQLGMGTRERDCYQLDDPIYCQREPRRVAGVATFETISAGGGFSCGIGGDGVLYCWGINEQGVLGIGADHAPLDDCGAAGYTTSACALEPMRVLGQPEE